MKRWTPPTPSQFRRLQDALRGPRDEGEPTREERYLQDLADEVSDDGPRFRAERQSDDTTDEHTHTQAD